MLAFCSFQQEIQKLKSRDVGSTSARGASFTKITNENEKIRKDLKKVSIFILLVSLFSEIC